MIYAASFFVERVVALVAAGDDWVLVFPATMSLGAAADYALRHIRAHIPAQIRNELRDTADLKHAG